MSNNKLVTTSDEILQKFLNGINSKQNITADDMAAVLRIKHVLTEERKAADSEEKTKLESSRLALDQNKLQLEKEKLKQEVASAKERTALEEKKISLEETSNAEKIKIEQLKLDSQKSMSDNQAKIDREKIELEKEKLKQEEKLSSERAGIDEKKISLEEEKMRHEDANNAERVRIEELKLKLQEVLAEKQNETENRKISSDMKADILKTVGDVTKTAAASYVGWEVLKKILDFEATGVVSSTGGKVVIQNLIKSLFSK